MIILRMWFNILEFYHLITRAVFKSLLFLYAGIIIHLIKNNRDIYYRENLREIIPFVNVIFFVSILSNRLSTFICVLF